MEKKVERNSRLVKMYGEGWRSTELARFFLISRQRIEMILVENGVTLKSRWGRNGPKT